jgi:hypothetical protein
MIDAATGEICGANDAVANLTKLERRAALFVNSQDFRGDPFTLRKGCRFRPAPDLEKRDDDPRDGAFMRRFKPGDNSIARGTSCEIARDALIADADKIVDRVGLSRNPDEAFALSTQSARDSGSNCSR